MSHAGEEEEEDYHEVRVADVVLDKAAAKNDHACEMTSSRHWGSSTRESTGVAGKGCCVVDAADVCGSHVTIVDESG